MTTKPLTDADLLRIESNAEFSMPESGWTGDERYLITVTHDVPLLVAEVRRLRAMMARRRR